MILALSGVEAIANLTGIMRADPGSDPAHPRVGRVSFKAILPVAVEVTVGTALLGWAMLSMPKDLKSVMMERKEDMLRYVAEHYAIVNFGPHVGHWFGVIVGIVFALLLLSAVNTAIAAMIGVLYMTSQDGEMPKSFTKLNRYGVPIAPLAISVGLPIIVLLVTDNFEALAGLYAIGVVGAICVNLGSCTFNSKLDIHWHERALMAFTFLLLCAVELTLAKTKPDALFFVMCVLIIGLGIRAWAQRKAGTESVAAAPSFARLVDPKVVEQVRLPMQETSRILVCVRGITPVLRYAFDEAQLRNASLYVLYVREISVIYQGPGYGLGKQNWKTDPEASAILSTALQIGEERGVPTIPVFATSTNAAAIIVDMSATLGVDFLMLGSSHRGAMTKLLRGNVVTEVASSLPDSISLVIYG